jgi:hypothetical protein
MSTQLASRISSCLTALLVAATLALAASATASPSRLTVGVGTNRTYSRAQLRPGETVVCHYRGHTLTVTAPTGRTDGAGAVWPLPGVNDRGLFYLEVSDVGKARYAVACGRGGHHSELVVIPSAKHGATATPLPTWLPAAEKQTLARVFGGAKPIRTSTIPYPRKVAVIFEFNHVVVCGTCGGPTDASIPRGRVIRVSFDRQTHRLNGTMQFCESKGTTPPRALCLHH